MKPSTKLLIFLVIAAVLVMMDHSYFHILNHLGVVHGCANGGCK